MPSFEDITRHEDAEEDPDLWVTGKPAPEPIEVIAPSASWPADFRELAGRIRSALGDRVLALEHVGSTSVPGLPAKPIIDIDLTVADSADEAAYVPALEAAGFALLIREPKWHQHRMLVATSPRSNVHVWSPGSPEAIRHAMFRDWLIEHPDDRARYAAAKDAAASATNAVGGDVMAYNRHKQAVIREILDHMFRAHGML